jgi:hypothetical protein
MFALRARYMPPPPPGVASPPAWGDPSVVRERLGAGVRDLVFDRATMLVPALSLAHFREATERASGAVVSLVETLAAADPAKLATFRAGVEALAAEYFADNVVRQGYLLTRATKA